MWPFKKHRIKEKDLDKFYEKMEDAGYKEPEIKKLENVIAETGIYKKHGLRGVKQYKSPVIFLIHDDGDVEVIEDAKAGLFATEIDGEKRRYVLEPRKMLSWPSPDKSEDLKGWILYEGEAQAYPVEVVQSAAQFDDICKEFEAVGEFDEWKKGFKWPSPQVMLIGLIGLVLFFTMGLPAINTYLNPHAGEIANQTLRNITINLTHP